MIKFILAVLICFIVHEAGHILIMIFSGIKIHAIYIPFITFVFEAKKFLIKKNSIRDKIFVVPYVRNITEDKSFCKYKKNYLCSLLAGPFFSILLLFISIVGCVFCRYEDTNWYIFMVLLNIVIILFCFRKKDNYIGDFVAIKMLKKNDGIFLTYLLDYYIAGIDYEETSDFLLKKGFLEAESNLRQGKYPEDILYGIISLCNASSPELRKNIRIKKIIDEMAESSACSERLINKIKEFRAINGIGSVDWSKYDNYNVYKTYFDEEFEGLSGYEVNFFKIASNLEHVKER